MTLQKFEQLGMSLEELKATMIFAETLYEGGKMEEGETKEEFFQRVCGIIYKNFKDFKKL